MKILIVSFDKGLVKKLKNLLPTHEIIEVKNGEEAIKTVRTEVDVVIYDAISGALSEEDINNMYKQRFGEAKFVILVDDLFPVDMGNILTPNKVRLSREDEIDKVPEVIEGKFMPEYAEEGAGLGGADVVGEPQIQQELPVSEPEQKEEFVIEHTSLEQNIFSPEQELTAGSETPKEEELQIPAFEKQTEDVKEETTLQEPVQEEELTDKQKEDIVSLVDSQEDGKKVLIVSFDSLLIDNIRNSLGEGFNIEVAKNTKEAMERKSDAQVVIYDAISGVIAEKGLMEMSQDANYKNKAYIILIDELFPITVDHIPLDTKIVLSREAEIHLIKEKVEEALSSVSPAQQSAVEESLPTEKPVSHEEQEPVGMFTVPSESADLGDVGEETISEDSVSTIELKAEENINIEELSASIAGDVKEEEIKEQPEEISPQKTEKQPQIPVENVTQEIKVDAEEIAKKIIDSVNFEDIVKKAIKESIDEDMISSLLRQEIESAFANVDVKSIIKEVVASIVREKVEELLS